MPVGAQRLLPPAAKKWLQVYAGNEAQGYKLSTAYRILNNTLGIHLTAAPNNTAVPDSSATGRAAPGCTGCHFEGPYPLDKVARVLTRPSAACSVGWSRRTSVASSSAPWR